MKFLTLNDLLKYINNNNSISFSIDRFEENFAVCENRLTQEMILISKELIPTPSKTGDILILKNNILVIDKKTTNQEQEEIKNLVNQLFKRKQ